MRIKEVSRSFTGNLPEGNVVIELVDITIHNIFNTGSDYGVLLTKYVLEFDLQTESYLDCVNFVREALNPKNDNRLQIRFI